MNQSTNSEVQLSFTVFIVMHRHVNNSKALGLLALGQAGLLTVGTVFETTRRHSN